MNLESGRQFGDYQNEIYLGGLSGVLPTLPVRSARTSSSRVSAAAIQGTDTGSAESSAALRSASVSP